MAGADRIVTYGLAIADFNGDGIPDLAVPDSSIDNRGSINPAVGILLGKGDGTFNPEVTYDPHTYATSITVGDFNGDGVPDVAANGGGVLLGNGDGTSTWRGAFTVPPSTSQSGNAQMLLTGDFNGDGILDIASTGSWVLLGNGNGTFTTWVQYNGIGNAPFRFAAGDFNGDGVADIAFSDLQASSLDIALNDLTTTATAVLNGVSGPSSNLVRAVYSGDSLYSPNASEDIGLGGAAAAPRPKE